MDEQDNPQLKAMHAAMKQAEEAAERRRLAKLKAEAEAPAPFELDADLAEDLRVIQETRVVRTCEDEPIEEVQDEPVALDVPDDLEAVLRQLDAEIPDLPDREVHGDLVVFRHDERAKAWYELAAEEALPESLRGLKGPIDVKRLLQAMIVEIGDVKRTNAILMELMTRLEEKVDRTNRLLKDKRFHS